MIYNQPAALKSLPNWTILALVDFQAIYRYIFRAEKTQPIRKRALFPENGGWQSIEKLL